MWESQKHHCATREDGGALGFTLERVGEHGHRPLRAEGPQDLAEQRGLGFLEDLSECLHRECVHRGSSVTGYQHAQGAMTETLYA